MKLILYVFFFFATALLAPLPVKAQEGNNGNDLLRQCNAAVRKADDMSSSQGTLELMEGMFCLGLMQGVRNTNYLYLTADKEKAMFCNPVAGGNLQAARIVLKYLNDHPEKLHLNDTLLVVLALKEAFPCPSLSSNNSFKRTPLRGVAYFRR